MVLTLPRPPADVPETAWQEVVQGGLDRLEALDPRDALQTMLAVHGDRHPGRPRSTPAGWRSRRTPRRCRRSASGPAPRRWCA